MRPSSPRPLGENPGHFLVQNLAPEKLPEAPAASRAYFLGLAGGHCGWGPKKAGQIGKQLHPSHQGKEGVGARRLKKDVSSRVTFRKCSPGYTILQRLVF